MKFKPKALYTIFTLLLITPFFVHAQGHEQKPDKKEIALIIDSLSNALNRWYIYPDKARTMISSIKKNYSNGAYRNAGNKIELSRLFLKDLQVANNDRHLEIVYDPALAKDLEAPDVPDTANNRKAYERNLKDAMDDNFAFRKTEILTGNIGYVRWDGFYGFIPEAMPTLNAAFRFVSHTKALIIDLRRNGGGSPEMVLQIQSYFFNQKTHMNDIIGRNNDTLKRWADPATTDFKLDMPVYILNSHGTFSGAEDFAYGMKYAKRAIVVGDTTGGGAHPTRPYSIGQGLVVFIPNQRSINIVTNTDWEGVGVWPDVAVPSNQSLEKAQTLIYTELLSSATDEHEKMIWQWYLISNENKALLAKQIQEDSIQLPNKDLQNFCGEYYTSDPNNPVQSVFVILKGNQIFRHLNDGAEDIRLVPISDRKFVYDDDSGRGVEFLADGKEGISEMILSTQQGEFRRNKRK
jgi:hypothetical protein